MVMSLQYDISDSNIIIKTYKWGTTTFYGWTVGRGVTIRAIYNIIFLYQRIALLIHFYFIC